MSLVPYSVLVLFIALHACFSRRSSVWSVYTSLALTTGLVVPAALLLTGGTS